MSKLKGPKTVAQVAKQEEEARARMGQSSDAYRSQVIGAQTMRQEFFNLQLPRILRVSTADGIVMLDFFWRELINRSCVVFERKCRRT